jgi:hypothetical protein
LPAKRDSMMLRYFVPWRSPSAAMHPYFSRRWRRFDSLKTAMNGHPLLPRHAVREIQRSATDGSRPPVTAPKARFCTRSQPPRAKCSSRILSVRPPATPRSVYD